MNRLIATNSVPFSGRDVAPGSGTPQYATDGVPGTTPTTIWPAYAWNMIQDELMALIAAAGITPDDTNWAQVLQALQNYFGRNRAVFMVSGALVNGTALAGWTNGGNFVIPAPTLFVRGWGAGGGSGGCTGASSAGGAGGGAGYVEGALRGLTVGANLAVQIGAGGTPGTGAGNGGNGGASSIGALSAAGGYGGAGGASTIGAGGTAGTGAGGDLNLYGQGGGQGYPVGGSTWVSGLGGGCFGTPPAGPGVSDVSEVGGAGIFPGGGAAGPLLAANGAEGASGLIIASW
jgi:hypothetical protein